MNGARRKTKKAKKTVDDEAIRYDAPFAPAHAHYEL